MSKFPNDYVICERPPALKAIYVFNDIPSRTMLTTMYPVLATDRTRHRTTAPISVSKQAASAITRADCTVVAGQAGSEGAAGIRTWLVEKVTSRENDVM